MIEERIAGLRTLLCGGPDREGGGDGPVICLLHGYGANGDDLAGLWRVLDVPREARFAFPEAPLPLGVPGWPSWAWWHIDVERIQARIAGQLGEKETAAMMDEEPAGLTEAREQITAWLAALRQRLGGEAPLPLSKVVLGGFSQGAMLSADVALHSQGEALAGLVLLSGALINRRGWQAALAKDPPRCPRFQSHGTEDMILPYPVGEAMHHFLQEAGFAGPLWRFRGGHEIPPRILDELGKAVSGWLG